MRTGEDTPIITAADFRLDDESSGITALLDSVANQHHAKLREKAMRNLEAVRDAVANTSQKVPHLEGIIGALWLRSLAESNLAGADMETLHVDMTMLSTSSWPPSRRTALTFTRMAIVIFFEKRRTRRRS